MWKSGTQEQTRPETSSSFPIPELPFLPNALLMVSRLPAFLPRLSPAKPRDEGVASPRTAIVFLNSKPKTPNSKPHSRAQCATVNNRWARLCPSYSPVFAVNKLVRTKASNFAPDPHCLPRSLIEQSKRSGLKNVAESTTGIIPGDRGMVGGSWCCQPLQAAKADARHISPVPLTGVVSGQSTYELGTERQGVIRNRARAESGPRDVSIRAPTQLPQRVLVATAQTRTQSRFPAGRPRQKAQLAVRAGRVMESRRRGASGPRQSPRNSSNGAA